MSEDIISRRPGVPHRAILWIQAEVHELMNDGQCHGDPVHSVPRFPLYLDGLDKPITIRKLNELIEEVREKCRSNRLT